MGNWWRRFTEKWYRLAMRAAQSPHALAWLGAVSFVESSFFPIPPDVFLIPIVLADRSRALRAAVVCTAASVAGALAGYGIGFGLYDLIAEPLIAFYGYQETFDSFAGLYNRYGAWLVAGAGLTPFPYKVIAIASGVMSLDLGVFIVASILSRGLRFAFVAWVIWRYGARIQGWLERNLAWLSVAFFVLLVAGFAALRYI
ncbi:hypothetical protein FACS1894186_1930 [Alphaproteobacteria bacterium]|nr:hypothetical protein FACS1894186_1930 [Alphaproteobacteria bacterium]